MAFGMARGVLFIEVSGVLIRGGTLYMYNYWGKCERAPPLMMSTALASVRPSSYVSQTAHARYSRDICGFKFC